jgi:hypothetical protein
VICVNDFRRFIQIEAVSCKTAHNHDALFCTLIWTWEILGNIGNILGSHRPRKYQEVPQELLENTQEIPRKYDH